MRLVVRWRRGDSARAGGGGGGVAATVLAMSGNGGE